MSKRYFKSNGTASVLGALFKEIAGFLILQNSGENSIMCIVMYRKTGLLEISRNSILTGVRGLQSTGCNTTKNELLNKFLRVLGSRKSSVSKFLFSMEL